ncbi:MAG: dTMP kinase [Candidatus Eremiobacteraeota bacterium]|nr:dTMP kinase [Candidatus Eremiobacteraeota bacterium]
MRLLAEALRLEGVPAVFTREPGGTELGEQIRALLIGKDARMASKTEALLLNAARAELVETIIAPALAAQQLVVSDRFWDSTLAYQGYGRGVALQPLMELNSFAAGGLEPHLTFLLDIPVAALHERLHGRDADRLERETPAFHERVAFGYRELASLNPQRFVVLDGTQEQGLIAAHIRATVLERWHA